jgi:hypothetical protein
MALPQYRDAMMGKMVLPNNVMLGEVSRLLLEGREVVLMPKGNSMRPFIRGEVDQVRLQRADELKVGDIVLAHFDEHYVLHRIIAIDGNKVTLMGDGNLQGVEEVHKSDVSGVVVEVIAPDGERRKPSNGYVWRKLLPVRKYLLKVYRKWNRIRGKQF